MANLPYHRVVGKERRMKPRRVMLMLELKSDWTIKEIKEEIKHNWASNLLSTNSDTLFVVICKFSQMFEIALVIP